MKALILCAGDQKRWRAEDGSYERGVPKQLVEVDGEPVLHRTVRQLLERGIGDITIVHRPREKTRYTVPFPVQYAPARLDPARHEADRFFSARHLWSEEGRTLLVYGDVYFTDAAADALVVDRNGWWAYARPGASAWTGCKHGEIFAFSFTPNIYPLVDEHAQRLVDLQDGGVINRSLGWELYRSLSGAAGRAVRRGPVSPNRIVHIDDFTEDFDSPDKLDVWLARFHGAAQAGVGVSVLVPARLDGQRQRLWDFLRPKWGTLGYQVVEGTCTGPWRKAEAITDALHRADGEVLVVADADVWCDGVVEAVEHVRSGTPWAMPHYLVRRLSKPTTAEVLQTGAWPTRRTARTFAQHPYPGRPGGGMVVLSRDAYRQVPMDPRFVGWGQEDESWALALGTMLGRSWRGKADLWHLWHDPMPRQSRAIGSMASWKLHRRYSAAARRPAKMSALLGEHVAVPA